VGRATIATITDDHGGGQQFVREKSWDLKMHPKITVGSKHSVSSNLYPLIFNASLYLFFNIHT
jgi:hypothetical protein